EHKTLSVSWSHYPNLPNMQRVVGMPDLHPGRGYPIGAAFFSVGRFYPTRRRCNGAGNRNGPLL
ncbi:TPA: hypothetical protein ISB92_004414, partial [Escherichia coli]|nr:hypothetical protein [Escherichia coli]